MADEQEFIGAPEVESNEDGTALSRSQKGAALIFSFLWRWVVVGAIFAILVGFAASAIYGDDFRLAAFLFAIGIFFLAAKALSWEDLRDHKDKMWGSLVIVILALILLSGCEFWVHSEYAKHEVKNTPTAPVPQNKPQDNQQHREIVAQAPPTSPKSKPTTPSPRPQKAAPQVSDSPVTLSNSPGSAVSFNQQGGVTAGTVNVDTPPLKLSVEFSEEPKADTLPPFLAKYAHRNVLRVAPNIIWQPVVFRFMCDGELKLVRVISPGVSFGGDEEGIAPENTKSGYVYRQNSDGAGTPIVVEIYSDDVLTNCFANPVTVTYKH